MARGVKIRLAFDTYKLSYRMLGDSLLALGGASLLLAITRNGVRPAVFGVAAALVGVWLRDMPSSVIMRSSDEVLDQVRRTLDLMSVGYNSDGDSVRIRSTGTIVRVQPLGPVALLTFQMSDPSSGRERYLARTLVSYQRFAQ